MFTWNEHMRAAMESLGENGEAQLDFRTIAIAAYREIGRLEARNEAIREAACCPPDCGMNQWLQTLNAALHDANELRCQCESHLKILRAVAGHGVIGPAVQDYLLRKQG